MKITKKDVEEILVQDLTLVRTIFKTVLPTLKSALELCDDKLVNWSSNISSRRKSSKDRVDRGLDKKSGE